MLAADSDVETSRQPPHVREGKRSKEGSGDFQRGGGSIHIFSVAIMTEGRPPTNRKIPSGKLDDKALVHRD